MSPDAGYEWGTDPYPIGNLARGAWVPMRRPTTDAYVVRVYRRGTAANRRLLVGVAEPVGGDEAMAFRSIDDLWRILVPAKPTRRTRMDKTRQTLRTVVAMAALLAATATAVHAAATFKLSAFTVVMNGAQVQASTNSSATGTGLVTLDEAQRNLCVRISSTVSGETAAKVRGPAFPTDTGPEIFPLTIGNPKADCGVLTKDQVKQLKAGLFYVEIQSGGFPSGEIRGQILPVGKGFLYKVPD